MPKATQATWSEVKKLIEKDLSANQIARRLNKSNRCTEQGSRWSEHNVLGLVQLRFDASELKKKHPTLHKSATSYARRTEAKRRKSRSGAKKSHAKKAWPKGRKGHPVAKPVAEPTPGRWVVLVAYADGRGFVYPAETFARATEILLAMTNDDLAGAKVARVLPSAGLADALIAAEVDGVSRTIP